MKIVLLHPDLGIGGAEKLIIDVALALKSKGHEVEFLTAHHDPSHCFPETKDGTLKVTVVGDWLPRSIFGRCQALCAYLRMVFAAFYLVMISSLTPDIVICDLVSACIPILRLRRNIKILFYCHFPDMLLTDRKNILKKIYRKPLDWIEERTTGMADVILVNSKFTKGIFHSTFQTLKVDPIVVYPSLDVTAFDRPITETVEELKLKGIHTIFLSINRYERKKHLNLALESLAALQPRLSSEQWKQVHLIMAGGYDTRVQENIEHLKELKDQAAALGLEDRVTFLQSPTDGQKRALLHSCTCLLYTPSNEHFGIVPLEAMYTRRPVIACNSGGPTETVVNNETGFLCEPAAEDFADHMLQFIKDKDLAREMGDKGRLRVSKHFSFNAFSGLLDEIVINLTSNKDKTL